MDKTLKLIIQEINNAKNLSSALNSMAQRIIEIINAEACSVFIVDTNRQDYVLLATSGLPKEYIHQLHVKLNDGLVGIVGQRGEPINIADTLAHPKFCHYNTITKKPYRAFLGVPIIHKKKLLGVLAVQKNEPHNFDESAEALLLTLAIHIAEIIAFAKATSDTTELAKSKEHCIFQGIPSVNGISIGKIVVVPPASDTNIEQKEPCKNSATEIIAFENALKAVRAKINKLQQNWSQKIDPAEYELFSSYINILTSQALITSIIKEIQNGNPAQTAVKNIFGKWRASLQITDNTYLRERSEDILNLEQRIIKYLNSNQTNLIDYPEKTILVGENITASDLIEVPIKKLTGIISLYGSHTSHTAILARALNIPTIMGLKNCSLTQLKNQEVIIDGYHGKVYLSPNKKLLQNFSTLAAQEQKLHSKLNELRDLPAKTKDGYLIPLLINAGLPSEITHALKIGIQGIGLYRTEIPFMHQDYFPTENEQYAVYREILQQSAPRKVVMRTLDAGGDKQLPYLPITETNPSLGWRGIRVTLDHPEILLIQIRAMLRADQGLKNLHILLPMVSDISEVKQVLSLIKQAHTELLAESVDIGELPKIGVMIEIPSAIYQIKKIAKLVDFFSVGSNDLTQYLLAVDRQNARVADIYNSLHPAVLKALTQIVETAHQANKSVSICGEMAGDPYTAILLIAIGFDALSMNANQLLKVKWQIRNCTMRFAKKILSQVMQMDDPQTIRNYLQAKIRI
jgi:phosphotransferase system, enzyme I, PtsP